MTALENSDPKETEDKGKHVEVLGDGRTGSDPPGDHGEKGLRTYGDDENHDIEPPVSSRCSMVYFSCHLHMLTVVDVLQSDHELDSNGFSLDWQSDSSVYLR